MDRSDQQRTEGTPGTMHLGRMICSKCGQLTPFERMRWDDVHKYFVCSSCREH